MIDRILTGMYNAVVSTRTLPSFSGGPPPEPNTADHIHIDSKEITRVP